MISAAAVYMYAHWFTQLYTCMRTDLRSCIHVCTLIFAGEYCNWAILFELITLSINNFCTFFRFVLIIDCINGICARNNPCLYVLHSLWNNNCDYLQTWLGRRIAVFLFHKCWNNYKRWIIYLLIIMTINNDLTVISSSYWQEIRQVYSADI